MDQPLFYDERDLWERYYEVAFRHFDTMTPGRLERFGQRVSGIPEYDREISTYTVTSFLTIDQMFELWRSGATVRVVNYADTAEIYEIIQRHLVVCAESIQNSINGRSTELMKDLIELDKFATVVYDKAKSIFTEQERQLVRNRSFSIGGNINMFNIFKTPLKRVDRVTVTKDGVEKPIMIADEQAKPSDVKDRNSLNDVFSEHLNRMGGLKA